MDPVFAALDSNQDGALSGDEITNARAALLKLDRNNDGQLTEEEVRPAFRGPGGPGGREGRPNPDEFAARIMSEFDRNNDGKLSREEMPERMREMFERADGDHDGFVSAAELKQMMQSPQRGR